MSTVKLLAIAALAAVTMSGSGEASAQTSVDARVQKLEETIQILERRVASLEAQLREQGAPADAVADKANWRKLKQGMTQGDVEKLLGSPSKIDEYGMTTVWHYGPYGEGTVQFYGTPRKANRWSEP